MSFPSTIAARARPPPGVCQPCFIDHNEIHSLVEADSRFMTCPICGVVDERATAAHQHVSIHHSRGSQLDEHYEVMTFGEKQSATPGNAYHEWKERTFQEDLKNRLNLYLADSERCVIEAPAPHLIKPVKAVFERIRELEREHRRNMSRDRVLERVQTTGAPVDEKSVEQQVQNFRLANDNEAWRLPCQIVSAVKCVVEDRNLLYINRKLGRKTDHIPANVVEDAEINSVPLNQMFWRMSHSHQKIKGDSVQYLQTTYSKTSELLKRNNSFLDDVLLCVLQVQKRIQYLMSLHWKERVQAFNTKPIKSSARQEFEVEWKRDQWRFFKHVDFEEVLPLAYELYLVQQSVNLWDGRNPAQLGITLCLWACIASAERYLPDFATVSRELITIFGYGNYGAGERSIELKNLLISFANSFEAAEVQRPRLRGPTRGGLGDGFHGYAGDIRRGIPELELAAGSVRTIALHWREVVFARWTQHYVVGALTNERDKARQLYAQIGERVGRRVKQQYAGRPMSLRRYNPFITVVESKETVPDASHEVIPAEPADNITVRQRDFIPPQEPETIEELLAMDEKSSADESVQSSHDGEFLDATTRPTSFSRALAALEQQTDYSYSINHHMAPMSSEIPHDASTHAAGSPWLPTSDISPSPALLLHRDSRTPTAQSDRASVSSTDAALNTTNSLGISGVSEKESSPSVATSLAPTIIHALSSAPSDVAQMDQEGLMEIDQGQNVIEADSLTLEDLQFAGEYYPIHVGLLARERPSFMTHRSPGQKHKSLSAISENGSAATPKGAKRKRATKAEIRLGDVLANGGSNSKKANCTTTKASPSNQSLASTVISQATAAKANPMKAPPAPRKVATISAPRLPKEPPASRINHAVLAQHLSATRSSASEHINSTPFSATPPAATTKRINFAALEHALTAEGN